MFVQFSLGRSGWGAWGGLGRPLLFCAERVPDHDTFVKRTGREWRNRPPRFLLSTGVAHPSRVGPLSRDRVAFDAARVDYRCRPGAF